MENILIQAPGPIRGRETVRERSARSDRVILPLLALLAGCSASGYVEDADEQVYRILGQASSSVTGQSKVFEVGRPESSLRERLLRDGGSVLLDLPASLDVAAENNRQYARDKEQLYTVALTLTREQHDFALRYGGGGSADASGTGDETSSSYSATASFSEDLSASVNTTSGARITASFVNTFLRDLLTSDDWDGGAILKIGLTQPLLRGLGERVVREPLTQAERNVVYQVRSFERARSTLAVQVVSDYYGVLEQIQNLRNERANLESVQRNRERSQELFAAGRIDINSFDQARQNELSSQNGVVTAENRLMAALDRFKLNRLGLPVDADVRLQVSDLDQLRELGVKRLELEEGKAIGLALSRRYDYRNALDAVEDAARGVLVSEGALASSLDFASAIEVPTEAGKPLKFDWSEVKWSVGFNLDLALDKLSERNAYRSALISLDVSMRSREQLEDSIKFEIRDALRNIQSTIESYRIQVNARVLAERRVDSTRDLFQANRVEQRDVNDAQDSLLSAQINETGALIDYVIAKLQLVRDLEGLVLESKGLRFDPGLPLPEGPFSDVPRGADN